MRRVFVGWLTCTYLYWVYQNPNDASTFILQSNLSRILLWFAGVVFSKRLSDSCMGHTKNCICIVSLEICTCNSSKWNTLTINNMLYRLYLDDHLNRNKSTIFADTCAIHAWQSWYTLSLHRWHASWEQKDASASLGRNRGQWFRTWGILVAQHQTQGGPLPWL